MDIKVYRFINSHAMTQIIFLSKTFCNDFIKYIFNNINSNSYLRLKLGISKHGNDIIDYVLGKFSKEECNIINNTFSKLDDIISDFVNLDRDKLMNKYNSM